MKRKNTITILAIESSCDETAAAVLRGNIKAKNPEFKTLSSVVRSQIKLHSKMGGVVPEVAGRAHAKAIRPVVERALREAAESSLIFNPLSLKKTKTARHLQPAIDYIAVTTGPGLMPSLLVGVEFAKGLSLASGIPMIAVNHMEGHLYSPFGESISNVEFRISKDRSKIKDQGLGITFPVLSAIVSGKHTELILQKNESHYQVLGTAVDDAAGEAFDKVAKLLGLPYPGGPEISKLALEGSDTAHFPRPMVDAPNFDFSFAGLKTAVLYYLQKQYPTLAKNTATGNLHTFNFGKLPKKAKANIARSFEEAVVDVLVTKTIRAAKKYNCQTISLSGGVAANTRLRAQLKVESEKLKVKFIVPDFRLCTDNAEMIAIASYFKLRAGYKPVTFSTIKADSSWELS